MQCNIRMLLEIRGWMVPGAGGREVQCREYYLKPDSVPGNIRMQVEEFWMVRAKGRF